MKPKENLIGLKFNRLTVVSYHSYKDNHSKWNCICECGNSCVVSGTKLKSGHTRSCGCYSREAFGKRNRTHGKSGDPVSRVYHHILYRCYDKDNQFFSYYGGRGIIVCDRWRGKEGLINFINDMGPRPKGYEVDRIDNNGPYSPENCRWASKREQSRNKRSNIILTFDGKTQCVTDWAAELNCSTTCIKHRLKVGWSIEDALTKPSQRSKKE